MYMFIVVLLASGLVAPAHAQVQVDIGIHFPAPPRLVVVPEVRTVQYVPAVPTNIFFYNGQYWALANGGWHVSSGYNGPWIVVAPQFVPRPLLLVPVKYYRVPPGHWKQWQKNQPPRWGEEWGREWSTQRGWKAREREREDEGEGGRGKGHGRGHGRGK